MKIKSFAASIISLFLVGSAFAQHVKTLENLQQAPGFSLVGQDGKTYSSSDKDLQGKVIVLEWFNNECPFVEKHYGSNNMQTLQKKYTAQGVKWFSISSTRLSQALTQADAKKIYDERKSGATALLLDSDGNMARAYGAKTTPHMFIIDTTGKIVYNGAIDNKPSFRKESLKGADNYVADALDSVLNSDPAKRTVKTPTSDPYGCSVKVDDKPSVAVTKK